jgi:hypothetical protein
LIECYLTIIAKNQVNSAEQFELIRLKLSLQLSDDPTGIFYTKTGLYYLPNPATATAKIKLEYRVTHHASRLGISEEISRYFRPGYSAVAQIINSSNNGCTIS